VISEVPLGREGFKAGSMRALERFLTGVDTQMGLQVSLLGKSLVAIRVRTLEWLFSSLILIKIFEKKSERTGFYVMVLLDLREFACVS
jgi:hypothetical protein